MSTTPSYTLVGINYWPEPTGNAPYNTDLAEMLAKKGNVTVITGIPHYPWWQKQLHHSDQTYILEQANLRLVRRNHSVPKRNSNFVRALMEITFGVNAIFSRKLAGDKIILISPAMLSSAVSLFWIRLRRPKTKVLLWVQDLYEQGIKETDQKVGLLSRVVFRIENWLIKNSDRVVMAHPKFLEAKKLSSQQNTKYLSLPNWSQFSYSPNENQEVTREKYGFGTSRIVLHIGNMGVKQGLHKVVEAAKISQQNDSSNVFVFVGGGNQLDFLRDESKGLDSVVFVPPVTEVELANLLQSADILLVHELPGVKEMSIPSKLTTYFQAGKPVLVCSEPDSLAAKSVLENGTGLWVKSGNPDTLLAKIDTLDLEEARKVAQVAKRYAKENLGKSEALAKFMSIINDL
jgi:glycosyltransferase involved in cell wall biosynthesis